MPILAVSISLFTILFIDNGLNHGILKFREEVKTNALCPIGTRKEKIQWYCRGPDLFAPFSGVLALVSVGSIRISS